MDTDLHLQNHENRLNTMQENINKLFDRMGKVEDKASAAWKTISEVNTKVDNLDKKVQGLELDLKEVKESQTRLFKSMKKVIVITSISLIMSACAYIYIYKQDADLAKNIVALGAAITGAIV